MSNKNDDCFTEPDKKRISAHLLDEEQDVPYSDTENSQQSTADTITDNDIPLSRILVSCNLYCFLNQRKSSLEKKDTLDIEKNDHDDSFDKYLNNGDFDDDFINKEVNPEERIQLLHAKKLIEEQISKFNDIWQNCDSERNITYYDNDNNNPNDCPEHCHPNDDPADDCCSDSSCSCDCSDEENYNYSNDDLYHHDPSVKENDDHRIADQYYHDPSVEENDDNPIADEYCSDCNFEPDNDDSNVCLYNHRSNNDPGSNDLNSGSDSKELITVLNPDLTDPNSEYQNSDSDLNDSNCDLKLDDSSSDSSCDDPNDDPGYNASGEESSVYESYDYFSYHYRKPAHAIRPITIMYKNASKLVSEYTLTGRIHSNYEAGVFLATTHKSETVVIKIYGGYFFNIFKDLIFLSNDHRNDEKKINKKYIEFNKILARNEANFIKRFDMPELDAPVLKDVHHNLLVLKLPPKKIQISAILTDTYLHTILLEIILKQWIVIIWKIYEQCKTKTENLNEFCLLYKNRGKKLFARIHSSCFVECNVPKVGSLAAQIFSCIRGNGMVFDPTDVHSRIKDPYMRLHTNPRVLEEVLGVYFPNENKMEVVRTTNRKDRKPNWKSRRAQKIMGKDYYNDNK